MFMFCALCSDNQMCLEIQNTKLRKSKKQASDHESLNIWSKYAVIYFKAAIFSWKRHQVDMFLGTLVDHAVHC